MTLNFRTVAMGPESVTIKLPLRYPNQYFELNKSILIQTNGAQICYHKIKMGFKPARHATQHTDEKRKNEEYIK